MPAVMVTRTGKAGQQLTEAIQQAGMQCWFMPTLKIIGQELLLPVEDFQQAIFLSPNAVKYSVEKSPPLIDMLPDELIAIGQGTAGRLQQVGFKQVVTPEQYNSEGLLALPQLQEVTGQQLLIIKGRGGRSLLGETLTARGAICHNLEVYCRVTDRIDRATWQAFLGFSEEKGVDKIVTITSVDAMQALHCNLGKDFDYRQLTLVVASQRIAEQASANGYQEIVIAESASNDSMLAAVTARVQQ